MSTFHLTPRVSFSTDRAESSYNMPVLVIDGAAYGPGDDFRDSLVAATTDENFPELAIMYTNEQILVGLCVSHSGYSGDAFAAMEMWSGN